MDEDMEDNKQDNREEDNKLDNKEEDMTEGFEEGERVGSLGAVVRRRKEVQAQLSLQQVERRSTKNISTQISNLIV